MRKALSTVKPIHCHAAYLRHRLFVCAQAIYSPIRDNIRRARDHDSVFGGYKRSRIEL